MCVSEEGVWDPDRWLASVCSNTAETNAREKRKQATDMNLDAGLRKRPAGWVTTFSAISDLHFVYELHTWLTFMLVVSPFSRYL